jgi:hypothetical protein
MAAPNQWGIREVAVATFYDIATGKALVQLTNLKTSGLENSANLVYARGGRGNPRLMGWSSDRDGKVTLQDAVFTNKVLAMMTGNGLVTASQNIYQRDVLTVNSNAATLNYTPVSTGALIGVYKANADGTDGQELTYTSSTVSTGKYGISGKSLTFFAGDIPNGNKVNVYYQTATDSTANKISVTADKFAGTFRVVLDCLVRDYFTQNDYAAQIIIYNAKMEDNWKFSMASTGDPSVFDINLEILKPVGANSSNAMWDMIIYDQNLLS